MAYDLPPHKGSRSPNSQRDAQPLRPRARAQARPTQVRQMSQWDGYPESSEQTRASLGLSAPRRLRTQQAATPRDARGNASIHAAAQASSARQSTQQQISPRRQANPYSSDSSYLRQSRADQYPNGSCSQGRLQANRQTPPCSDTRKHYAESGLPPRGDQKQCNPRDYRQQNCASLFPAPHNVDNSLRRHPYGQDTPAARETARSSRPSSNNQRCSAPSRGASGSTASHCHAPLRGAASRSTFNRTASSRTAAGGAAANRTASGGIASSSSTSGRAASPLSRIPRIVAPLLICALLVAIIAVIASTCSRNSTPAAENASQPTTAASVNESANDDASHTFFETIQGNASSIAAASSNIPDGSVQAFSLAGNAAPTLSQSHQDAIEQALDAYGSTATFVVLNLASGQGICHNAHDSLFGASSFKATYCAYLCSQLVESGTLALSSPVPNATTDYDPASPDDWEDPLCLGGLMQNTLILSDNTAYETLRVYDYLGYDEWMNALGLNSLLYSPRTWYPDYSAAQGFIMWANIYSYMQSNSATATWLQQQMQKTQLSFLRNGLSERAQVLCSKAGWDDDVENGFTAMSDGGILQTENATFLVSILTAKPGVEETFPAMNALVNSIIGTALDVLSQE